MSLEGEVFALLADNAELMTQGGEAFETLTSAQLYQYKRSVGTYMSLIYSAYIQHDLALVESEVWEAYKNALARHTRAPDFKLTWERIKVGYPRGLQQIVDERFGRD